jgi:phytoene dehydrogenase-like protein
MPATYDATIIGAGHNGLVAACYLAMAGKSVLVIEREDAPGGASVSHQVFPDYEANLSRYSYLISLFPQRIIRELGLDLELLPRKISSYTPHGDGGGTLIPKDDEGLLQRELDKLGPREWQGYRQLSAKQAAFAHLVWDSLLEPLRSRAEWERHFNQKGQRDLWRDFVERPIGELIERHVESDVLRGILLTDAKIGANTHAHDPSLLQNRTYIYHVIGNRTGDWLVPRGGMGNLTAQLVGRATSAGAQLLTGAQLLGSSHDASGSGLHVEHQGRSLELRTRHLLWNATPPSAQDHSPTSAQEGTAFKINMLLKHLPRPKDRAVSPGQAFAGTYHIDESYSQLQASWQAATDGQIPDPLPGEIYCHTLTDPSILSPELQREGFHTLTYFGLDLPYSLFTGDNAAAKEVVVRRFMAGINRHLDTPIEGCLALDHQGEPCIEAMSAVDLEAALGLPRGNIFHRPLSWFFAEQPSEAGRYGCETDLPHVWVCGSSARRGGAVSGIPGRNAAIAILSSG